MEKPPPFQRDALPPFGRAALLLDMDGTLIDLAATPDAVVVPPGLADVIADLRDALDGALAIVTGRPIQDVDRLFGTAPGAVVGEHGGAMRLSFDAPVWRPDLPALPPSWLDTAEKLARAFPGALLERKARGFALHYRLAPEAGPVFQAALAKLVDTAAGFQLLAGLMLYEVRPAGVDKGVAVATLMRQAPYAGRMSVFIGDDVTDEDGIREARKQGGAGYRVDHVFGDPDGVRSWLRRSAAARDWATLPRR